MAGGLIRRRSGAPAPAEPQVVGRYPAPVQARMDATIADGLVDATEVQMDIFVGKVAMMGVGMLTADEVMITNMVQVDDPLQRERLERRLASIGNNVTSVVNHRVAQRAMPRYGR